MGKVLLAAHPASGHINPLLSIGDQLRHNGHRVLFSTYGPRAVRKRIATAGFEVFQVAPTAASFGLTLLPLFSGYRETAFAVRCMMGGLVPFARRYSRLCKRIKPDLVVSEFTFLGPTLAAECAGLPHAIIYHAGLALPGPGVPPFASGLPIGGPPALWPQSDIAAGRELAQAVDRAVADAFTSLAIRRPPPVDLLARMPSPFLNLTLTTEASEAPRDPPPETTYFVGPCFTGERGEGAGHFPFDRLDPQRKKIFISLGTVFNKKPRVFASIIESLGASNAQLIVSAGRAFRRLLRQSFPESVLLFEKVPQVALLPHVDAVISHGGNNTVNETLAAGKPLLVLPVGGEQGDNAARVVHLGVGLRASINDFAIDELRAKSARLLNEPTFTRTARRIAEAIGRTDGPTTAARFLAHLMTTGQPLVRPEGYPLTVERNTPGPWEWTR